jgi:hypothetical protein
VAKQRYLCSPIPDANVGSLNRFLVELNLRLDEMAERLPSLDKTKTIKLKELKATAANAVSRKATEIPKFKQTATLDVTSLKDALELEAHPAAQTELTALKNDIKALGDTLNLIIDVLTD